MNAANVRTNHPRQAERARGVVPPGRFLWSPLLPSVGVLLLGPTLGLWGGEPPQRAMAVSYDKALACLAGEHPMEYDSEYSATYGPTPDYAKGASMRLAGVEGAMAKAMAKALDEEAIAKQLLDPSLVKERQSFDNVYSAKFRNFDTASQIAMGDHLNMSRTYIAKTPHYAGYEAKVPQKNLSEAMANYRAPTSGVANMQAIIDAGKVTFP